MKCQTIDCAPNTFLLLQKHLTPGTELILIGWKVVPNEEHVQCDHRFASQPLANEPLHSSQPFRHKSSESARHNKGGTENVAQLRAHIVKLCRGFPKTCTEKL